MFLVIGKCGNSETRHIYHHREKAVAFAESYVGEDTMGYGKRHILANVEGGRFATQRLSGFGVREAEVLPVEYHPD